MNGTFINFWYAINNFDIKKNLPTELFSLRKMEARTPFRSWLTWENTSLLMVSHLKKECISVILLYIAIAALLLTILNSSCVVSPSSLKTHSKHFLPLWTAFWTMGYGNLQKNQFEIRKFKTKISKIFFVLLYTSNKEKYTNQSDFL